MMPANTLPCTSAARRLLSTIMARCCVSAQRATGSGDVHVPFEAIEHRAWVPMRRCGGLQTRPGEDGGGRGP